MSLASQLKTYREWKLNKLEEMLSEPCIWDKVRGNDCSTVNWMPAESYCGPCWVKYVFKSFPQIDLTKEKFN